MGASLMQLENARIPGCSGLQHVSIQDGVIHTIQPMDASVFSSTQTRIDVAGDWLSLGGIDLQINGALGLAFPDVLASDQGKLHNIRRFLWQQGVDGFLPTLVTTSVKKFQQALAVLSTQTLQTEREQAQILGVHLEGPCLNVAKRGAHPQEYLQALSIETLQAVMGSHRHIVKVITLAPELEPSGETVAWLRSHDIIVSLGHSLATAAEADAAFTQGASMVTHAYNAMPSLHHRQPGLLATALMHPQVWCGFIADGQHVDPLMLKLMLKASPRQGLFLVSDALSPLGLADGVYTWDSRQIRVTAGTARLPDGTLSGTTLPLLEGVQNLVRWGLCSVGRAIALATEAPRHALGLPGLAPGQPAHGLLRWRYQTRAKMLSWQRLFPTDDASLNGA